MSFFFVQMKLLKTVHRFLREIIRDLSQKRVSQDIKSGAPFLIILKAR